MPFLECGGQRESIKWFERLFRMRLPMKRCGSGLLAGALSLLVAGSAAFAQTDPLHVASPDGQLMMRLFIMTPQDSRLVRLAYQVTFHGKLLIDTSLLGIALSNQEPFLGENVGLVTSKEE